MPRPGRVVHCKREPHDVYIGRPGPWGNPYSHDRAAVEQGRAEYLVGSREEAVDLYRQWYEFRLYTDEPGLADALRSLQGLTLGCWCAPQACHGDVLLELAERLSS